MLPAPLCALGGATAGRSRRGIVHPPARAVLGPALLTALIHIHHRDHTDTARGWVCPAAAPAPVAEVDANTGALRG